LAACFVVFGCADCALALAAPHPKEKSLLVCRPFAVCV
jgi:hypothetical protein